LDPRQEALERVGGEYDVRVLEPSPPPVTEPPWFADDPVARGDAPAHDRVVSRAYLKAKEHGATNASHHTGFIMPAPMIISRPHASPLTAIHAPAPMRCLKVDQACPPRNPHKWRVDLCQRGNQFMI
jgi:hypothetical protein